MCGSHGLSAIARWTKSSRPEGPKAGPKVIESYITSNCISDGLPVDHGEVVVQHGPEGHEEQGRSAHLSLPFSMQIGYKVISSSSFVTGPKRFDTKDTVVQDQASARNKPLSTRVFLLYILK